MIQSYGYAAQSPTSNLAPWAFKRRDLADNDILIDILYCGVCHSDLHSIRDDWFPGMFPMVPGHEIVGRVAKIGNSVAKFAIGDLVGVGVMVDSCLECENCKNYQEQFCATGVQTYNAKGHDGQPVYGGYADNIVVREEFVLSVSEKLAPEAVAPLLCAGITTYSPLKNWKVGKGHKLAVVGLGGLGHMAVKFGIAFGAEVTVLSTSESKREDAKLLGAHHFVVTKDEEQIEKVKSSFDFILDTVSAKHDINQYLSLLNTNGVHICVGIPLESFEVSPFSLVAGNKALAGSGAGGLAQTQEMLDYCAEHNIVSDVEVIDIKDIHHAFERMEKGDVRYRFVIDMATIKN
ncbi:putative zinc-type alcohol dehydrogenase-like protein [Pedobacter psychrotolerans]|uniref:Alcohol dehydrogenase n=1 Tax=Pedobacter psychrotolerans TaxID=1843235 RepID=A0A4R2HD58_9SPHI|nr:NAD(P)-dependent alcohol dehydrogenase [Pedobacter psychrotolerans]TCO25251.1 putative zinc-type alcohol dehydrogenase-like protein [Pedobacter psychrotolerans]GGE46935.1 alcohol dehydrogenase [Pedobacter psychrotolerans]